MKKIILVFTLFLLCNNVKALEYGVWTDEVSNNDNDKLISSEARYRWYKEEVIYSPDYYIEWENDPSYPYVSYDDYLVTNFTDWSEGYPDVKPHRIIDDKVVHRYRTLRPIRYLFLTDFENFLETTKVTEINVLINDIELDVNIICDNCHSSFNRIVSDGLNDEGINIPSNSKIVIDLGGYYDINTINLEVFFYDTICDDKRFNVHYNEGSSINDRNYAIKKVLYNSNFDDDYILEKIVIKPDAESITNPVFNDWIYIDGMVNATYYRQMMILCFYKYSDTLFKYYKIERDYLDDYYSIVSDEAYIRDDESFKMFYIYADVTDNLDDQIVEEVDNEEGKKDDNSGNYHDGDDSLKNNNDNIPIEDENSNKLIQNNNDTESKKKSEVLHKQASIVENSMVLNKVTKNNLSSTETAKGKSINDDKLSTNIIENKKSSLLLKKQEFDIKSIIVSFFLIMFISLFFIIRHHILSHQK